MEPCRAAHTHGWLWSHGSTQHGALPDVQHMPQGRSGPEGVVVARTEPGSREIAVTVATAEGAAPVPQVRGNIRGHIQITLCTFTF